MDCHLARSYFYPLSTRHIYSSQQSIFSYVVSNVVRDTLCCLMIRVWNYIIIQSQSHNIFVLVTNTDWNSPAIIKWFATSTTFLRRAHATIITSNTTTIDHDIIITIIGLFLVLWHYSVCCACDNIFRIVWLAQLYNIIFMFGGILKYQLLHLFWCPSFLMHN